MLNDNKIVSSVETANQVVHFISRERLLCRVFILNCLETLLLYRHKCFTGKYTTRKIHKNYIRDPSGLFSIISHVSLSMISLISSLSLKLYLNSLVYHRNIFGSSSKVFGNLRQCSEIFGHLRKFLEILRKCSGALIWPSEQVCKIFGNLRKVLGNLRNIIKNAVISMSI